MTHRARAGNPDHFKVTGEPTVHGISKPVVLNATLNKAVEHPIAKAPALGFDAVATIRRSGFGLAAWVPMVSDEVQIAITVEAIEEQGFAREMAEFAAQAASRK